VPQRRRHHEARACLDRLLDRLEVRDGAASDLAGCDAAGVESRGEDAAESVTAADAAGARAGRRIVEYVAQRFDCPESAARFHDYVGGAARVGAVRLHRGRGDLAHLLDRVELVDPDRLFEYLGRPRRRYRVAEAIASLRRLAGNWSGPRALLAQAEIDRLEASWRAGGRRLGLSLADAALAADLVAALSAVMSRDPSDGGDIRTFSRRTCGDSKLIEGHVGRILTAAREAGAVDPDLDAEEAAGVLGLEKFPHPIYVAGSLLALERLGGGRLPIGIHPFTIGDLEIPPLRGAISVENYASFNRYVFEAMGPGEVVDFTGGWPSRAARALVARLAARAGRLAHWGDIDMAGAGIADMIWRAAGRDLLLHLMDPMLARQRGRPERSRPIAVEPGSPAAGLIAWLSGPDAHVLEQEAVDPEPIFPVDEGS
jgi:hypothetical protein